MSTDTIFRQLGRINESYTGIGPGKTREEYLKLFSRASYSTTNDWPYSSPFAGFYDVSNTSTGLILVNRRYKYSHLRGKVLPKETRPPSEDEYKTFYEAFIESEREKKLKDTRKIAAPRTPVDPYRHFESQNKYWHNRMCKGSCAVDDPINYTPAEENMTLRSRRPQTAGSLPIKRSRSLSNPRRPHSAFGVHDKLIHEVKTDPAFAEAILQFYRYIIEKFERPKLGLQQYRVKEPPNRRLRRSGIYQSSSLTRGQKLYLLEKCHIYDIEDSKVRHKNAYAQVLAHRLDADLPAYKFGLNDPKDYFKYANFLKNPRPTVRPLNTGYFTSKKPHQPRIPGDYKKEKISIHSHNCLDNNDFISGSNSWFPKQKSSKNNSSNPSRRISASTLSTRNENTSNSRFRHEPKQIRKISASSTQPHD